METSIVAFKGKPAWALKEGKRIYLAFGRRKAKLIVEYIEQIRKFAESED